MPPNDRLRQSCGFIFRGLKGCSWPVILAGVVLAATAVYYTLAHLTIDTSRKALISSPGPAGQVLLPTQSLPLTSPEATLN